MARAFEGKVALVTGASSGIGRSVALKLSSGGAFVIVHYRKNKTGAGETLAQIKAEGGMGHTVGADISRTSEIDAMFESIDQELRRRNLTALDILVNNAGMPGGGASGEPEAVANVSEELMDQLFATNVRGTVMVTQRALPRLRDGGRIINISSMVSVAAYPDALAYAMSKAAVNSFTRSIAVDLGKRRITVNAVAPGAINTDFIRPLLENPELAEYFAKQAAVGRIGEPEDVSGAVAFLASPEAGYITGQVIQASGGTHL